MKLEEIATPLAFSGFTAATLEHFAPQLRALGMDPQQGVSGGGNLGDRLGDPRTLEPGSMISVHLMSGDMNVDADGTLTAIDGDKVYAFGHRFMAMGPTDLPFAKAEVLALLPNLANSFKISQGTEWMGSITSDRDTAISGIAGRRASVAPVEIRVGKNDYKMTVVRDPVLTPLVTQMAVFSAIDSTERGQGAAAYALKGRADFDGGTVRLDNVYSGDTATAAMRGAGRGHAVSYAMTSGFDALRLKSITLDITPAEVHKQVQIADVEAPRQARPGEDVEIGVTLSDENGAETRKQVHYRVPVGAPAGTLYLTVTDAASANLLEFQGVVGTPGAFGGAGSRVAERAAAQHQCVRAGVAGGPVYTVEGRDLPNPPASIAAILGRTQPNASTLASTRGTTVTEIEIPAGDNLVSGTSTIQIEVKE